MMELKDEDHSAPPIGAAGYSEGPETLMGGSGEPCGSALPMEHPSTSLSMMLAGSSST